MTAAVNKLSALHSKLADTFVEALEAEQIKLHANEELNMSLLKTISSFLKENNITTDISDGSDENETVKKLAELRKKRTNRIASTPVDGLSLH